MRDYIDQELTTLESTHGIHIPLAVESGSRAWGFASPDSDFDLRFIYVQPLVWYLTVHPGRDTMEAMLPRELDMSGWELRKTLDLFAGCNCPLYEWLGSPIIYREVGDLATQLRALIPAFFNPIKACHHYRKTGISTRDSYLQGNEIGIKKLFYILRPLLACEWIATQSSQPPTAFADLLAADLTPADIRAVIDDFLVQKADAVEGQKVAVPTALLSWIDTRLAYHADAHARLSAPKSRPLDALDDILREAVTVSR